MASAGMTDGVAGISAAALASGQQAIADKANAVAQQAAQRAADAGAQMLEKKLQPVAERMTKKEKELEGKLSNEAAYALMGALGPFGEPLQAIYDAMRDAEPAIATTQGFLAILVPILQQAQANQEVLTLPGAVKKATPMIAKAMKENGMPVTAAVMEAAQSPELQAKIEQLKKSGEYTDGHGQLTQAAQTMLHEHMLGEAKKVMPEKHHQRMDAAYTLATGRKAPAPKPKPPPVAPKPRPKTPPPVAPKPRPTPKPRTTTRKMVAQKAGGIWPFTRRKRLRNPCPPRSKNGLGIQLMNRANGRPRYRWITEIRPDGRMKGRAPKVGVLIRDLCLLRPSDFGPEKLLPASESVRKRPNQTRRINRLRRMRAAGRRPRSRRHLTKRH